MNWFPCFSIEDFSEVMSLKIILQILKERRGKNQQQQQQQQQWHSVNINIDTPQEKTKYERSGLYRNLIRGG